VHVAVGPGAQHLEPRIERHEHLAPQRAAHDLDQRLRQMGEVTEGLVLDLTVFALATAQQVGRVHTALVAAPRGDDMNRAATF